MSPEATFFRIRWNTPADLAALTDVFVRGRCPMKVTAMLSSPTQRRWCWTGTASPKG